MFCYECCKNGQTREAVGICHHCSAALCANHAHTVDDPVTAIRPLNRIVVLPKHARLMLCETCLFALQQVKNNSLSLVG